MSSIFLHRFEMNKDSSVHEVLLVFSIRNSFQPEQAIVAIQNEIDENLAPDEVLFVVPKPVFEIALDILEKDEATGALLKRFRQRTTFRLIGYGPTGENLSEEHVGGPASTTEIVLSELCRPAITSIFRKRGGFVEASKTYHFVNPSGRHTERFMRLSNILVKGAEIGFIAFACLSYIDEYVDEILIDTPALFSVVAAINELRSLFEKPLVEVDSFSSYEGLAELDGSFGNHTLVLISASSSGGLAERLNKETGFNKNFLLHLLYLGRSSSDYPIICDLQYDAKENPDGVLTIPTTYTDTDNCTFCQSGSFQVHLHGDQFDIKGPQPEPLLIGLSDAPPGLSGTMGRFAGTGAFGIWLRGDNNPRARSVYINPEKLECSPKYQQRLDFVLRRSVPASVNIIIPIDESSQKMAERVLEFVQSCGGTSEVLPRAELDSLPEQKGEPAFVVVCSAIESGRCLTDISRDLRTIARDAPIIYLVGFEKTTAMARREALKKTLIQNTHPVNHEYVTVEKMILPASGKPNAWMSELEFLRREKDHPAFVEQCCADFKHRIKLLSSGQAPLNDELFWPSPSGEPLELQPGFVFWDGELPKNYSQADVLFTISSILQRLRANAEARQTKSAIRSLWYHQTVLDPDNFTRFNDDIIQAALLRAARPAELNYSESQDESRTLSRLIAKIIQSSSGSKGGAATEFLIALATRRLQLCEEDHLSVTTAAQSQSGIVKGFGDYLSARDLPPSTP